MDVNEESEVIVKIQNKIGGGGGEIPDGGISVNKNRELKFL